MKCIKCGKPIPYAVHCAECTRERDALVITAQVGLMQRIERSATDDADRAEATTRRIGYVRELQEYIG